jgi:hypothetical protein
MAKEYQWQKHPPFRKRPYIRVQKLTIKQINKEITVSACTMKYGQPYPGSLWSCNERQSILIKPQTGNIFYNPPPKKKNSLHRHKILYQIFNQYTDSRSKISAILTPNCNKKELHWWFLKSFIFCIYYNTMHNMPEENIPIKFGFRSFLLFVRVYISNLKAWERNMNSQQTNFFLKLLKVLKRKSL